jgi:hypothetical protein
LIQGISPKAFTESISIIFIPGDAELDVLVADFPVFSFLFLMGKMRVFVTRIGRRFNALIHMNHRLNFTGQG